MDKLYINKKSKSNMIKFSRNFSIKFIPEDLFIDIAMNKDMNEDKIKDVINSLSSDQLSEMKNAVMKWKNNKPSSSDEIAVIDGAKKVNKLINFNEIDKIYISFARRYGDKIIWWNPGTWKRTELGKELSSIEKTTKEFRKVSMKYLTKLRSFTGARIDRLNIKIEKEVESTMNRLSNHLSELSSEQDKLEPGDSGSDVLFYYTRKLLEKEKANKKKKNNRNNKNFGFINWILGRSDIDKELKKLRNYRDVINDFNSACSKSSLSVESPIITFEFDRLKRVLDACSKVINGDVIFLMSESSHIKRGDSGRYVLIRYQELVDKLGVEPINKDSDGFNEKGQKNSKGQQKNSNNKNNNNSNNSNKNNGKKHKSNFDVLINKDSEKDEVKEKLDDWYNSF